MTIQELDNVMNLIKKYKNVFLSSYIDIVTTESSREQIGILKTISKLMKEQMKEKTSKNMSLS